MKNLSLHLHHLRQMKFPVGERRLNKWMAIRSVRLLFIFSLIA